MIAPFWIIRSPNAARFFPPVDQWCEWATEPGFYSLCFGMRFWVATSPLTNAAKMCENSSVNLTALWSDFGCGVRFCKHFSQHTHKRTVSKDTPGSWKPWLLVQCSPSNRHVAILLSHSEANYFPQHLELLCRFCNAIIYRQNWQYLKFKFAQSFDFPTLLPWLLIATCKKKVAFLSHLMIRWSADSVFLQTACKKNRKVIVTVWMSGDFWIILLELWWHSGVFESLKKNLVWVGAGGCI